MEFSTYPTNPTREFTDIQCGRLSLISISLLSFYSKTNKRQINPVMILYTTLWGCTPFPISYLLAVALHHGIKVRPGDHKALIDMRSKFTKYRKRNTFRAT
jgi:hypothetical protein